MSDKTFEALSTEEVAEILDMDVRWVEAQCRAKRIIAAKFGHRWRIAPEHLVDYLEECLPIKSMSDAWTAALKDLKNRTGEKP